MKIALDYYEAALPNRAGKGEYVFQLTRTLLRLYPNTHFFLLIARGQKVDQATSPNVTVVTIPSRRNWLWHILAYLWLTTSSVSAYFSTTSVIIPGFLFRPSRIITTIFDFTSWRFPKTHYQHAHWIEKFFMQRALARSTSIISISSFTKQEAIDLFGVPAKKIRVVPLAVDPAFFGAAEIPATQLEAVRKKYHLPPSFILCLATIEPRKNMTAIIESYRQIKNQIPGTKLVLAGNAGWYSDQILSQAGTGVIITGYIDDQDRPALYRLANLFVFPSLYEGFGLPPLEAITAGTPTIVSNRASLPEVVGSVGHQVSLDHPDDLTNAIREMLAWSPRQKEIWRKQAMLWAKQFSWEKTAWLTGKILNN